MPGKNVLHCPKSKPPQGSIFQPSHFWKVRNYIPEEESRKHLSLSQLLQLYIRNALKPRGMRGGNVDGTAQGDFRLTVTMSDQTLCPNNKFQKTSNSEWNYYCTENRDLHINICLILFNKIYDFVKIYALQFEESTMTPNNRAVKDMTNRIVVIPLFSSRYFTPILFKMNKNPLFYIWPRKPK